MSIVDAIYNRKNDLLAALIEEKKEHLSKGKGSKPSAGSLLHLAVQVNNHKALQILLDNAVGGDLVTEDSMGRMPLHLAVEKNSYECAEILCNHTVQHKPSWLSIILKTKDKKNNLPIYFAVRNPTMLQLIIKAVKDTAVSSPASALSVCEKQPSSGLTPLHIASVCGARESCALLLELDKDILVAPNRSQETALMVACKEGHADVVKLLCEARVDDTYLNLQNIDGDTALHLCFMMGHEALGHYLISEGCQQDIKNKQSNIAYDYQSKLAVLPNDDDGEENVLDESLVSIVRNLPIVDLNLKHRKLSPYAVVDDSKLSAREYLEKYILPDLQESLVALLKRREKNLEKPKELRPVEVDPCHWIASYLLRHKKD